MKTKAQEVGYELMKFTKQEKDIRKQIARDTVDTIKQQEKEEVEEYVFTKHWWDDLLKKELLTRPIKWLEEKNKEYPLLVNYVDARNKVAIRWLRFLGFTFIRKIEKYGVGRKPFYEFVRISSHV